jgi:hypothetical protein
MVMKTAEVVSVESLAQTIQDTTGIVHDSLVLGGNDKKRPDSALHFVGTADSGRLDTHIEVYEAGAEQTPNNPHESTYHSSYSWHGKLRHTFRELHLSPETIPGIDVLTVETISSPDEINDLQRSLQREPGVDSFKVVRQPGRRELRDTEWVQGFMRKEVWISDHTAPGTEWRFAQHDLRANDHILSWIATPPKYVDRVADSATALSDRYGDSIGNPKRPPKDVKEFAEAADKLSGFVRRVVKPVLLYQPYDTVDPRLGAADRIQELTNAIEYTEPVYSRLWINRNPNPLSVHLRVLKTLGILDPGAGKPELRSVAAEFAVFTALQLRNAQVLSSNDSYELRTMLLDRDRFYGQVIEAFAV